MKNDLHSWFTVSAVAAAVLTLSACGSGGSDEQPPADLKAPVITSAASASSMNENTGASQVVYTAAATDDSGLAVTYQLKPGEGDAASFSINATSGEVTLLIDPDFETKPSYTFTVVATDAAGNSAERVVTLAILDVNEAPPASLTDLQGRWTGTVGTQKANAMMLADGTAWVVQVDGADAPVAVTKGQWSVVGDAYSGTGRRVNVGSGTAEDVAMAVSSLAADTSMAGTLGSSNFSWTYAEGGEALLTLAAMAGTWAGNVDAARATVTWTLTSAGALTGSSTTGCTYEGLLAADTGVAAVSLSVTETCAGVAKALSGIGTLDASGLRASFPYIADDESDAGVFRLTKQ